VEIQVVWLVRVGFHLILSLLETGLLTLVSSTVRLRQGQIRRGRAGPLVVVKELTAHKLHDHADI